MRGVLNSGFFPQSRAMSNLTLTVYDTAVDSGFDDLLFFVSDQRNLRISLNLHRIWLQIEKLKQSQYIKFGTSLAVPVSQQHSRNQRSHARVPAIIAAAETIGQDAPVSAADTF